MKILVDFVARTTVLPSLSLKSMVAFQLHPIVYTIILECSIKRQQSSLNVPIHCPLCPPAVSGDALTIWKYNALYHLISEHSSGSTPPLIPGQLLVQMFITKEEE